MHSYLPLGCVNRGCPSSPEFLHHVSDSIPDEWSFTCLFLDSLKIQGASYLPKMKAIMGIFQCVF